MSAYAGIWNLDGAPIESDCISQMRDELAQYGPDGLINLTKGNVSVVFRPFHTTKESKLETQPFIGRGGQVILWDGRLDNRNELLQDLCSDVTLGSTDGSIVAAAYEKWERDSFSKLVGEWSLSIWDPSHRTLFLAIDHAGIRHAFYHATSVRVIWCTHLLPLIAVAGRQFELNCEYVAGYVTSYPDAHLTPFCGVQAVPPGSFVEIRDGQPAGQRYWSLRPKRQLHYKLDSDYEEHFRHLFRQAVHRRLRADGPVLAELSGGLDSSSIVCVADDIITKSEETGLRLDTISYYDPTEPSGDERPYFATVEQKRGRTGHHVNAALYSRLPLFNRSRFAILPGALFRPEDFEAEINTIMQQGGYRVILSGIGGDEFLGGAPDPVPQLADLIVQLNCREFVRQLSRWSAAKKKSWARLFLHSLTYLLPASVRCHFAEEGKVPSWVRSSFAKDYNLRINQVGRCEDCRFWSPSRNDFLRTFSAVSRQMARSVPPTLGCEERRFPYLDRDLLEFLIAIPAAQLLRPGQRRSLMRRALASFLPPDVLRRSTKAFTVRGYMLAIESNWRELVSLFTSPATERLGYLNRARFMEALREARSGKAPQLARMIRVISLECWLQDMMAHGIIGLHNGLHLRTGMNPPKIALAKSVIQGLFLPRSK